MTTLILCSIAIGIILGTNIYFIVKAFKINKKLKKKKNNDNDDKEDGIDKKLDRIVEDFNRDRYQNMEEEVYERFLKIERENKWNKGE